MRYQTKAYYTHISDRVREEGGHAVEGHRPDLGLEDCATVLPEIARSTAAVRELSGGSVPYVLTLIQMWAPSQQV